MKASFVLSALFLPTLAQAQTQIYFTNTVNERAISCPEDPSQVGYKHVTDVNVDQQSELDRVAAGQAPRKPYVFPFCNNFKFLSDQAVLKVLLDDVKFVCGFNGTNAELCVFEGGQVQVEIPENAGSKNVVIEGMSFFGSEGVSIQAYGAGSSKLTLTDVSFQKFLPGSTAVHQFLPQGGVPMEVEVNKATFIDGIGANLFDNVGGVLTFTDMQIIEGVQADSMIRTSAGGTSTLTKVNLQQSAMTRLTHTLGGSRQTVTGVSVTEMHSVGSIFFAEGGGSFLTVRDVDVTDVKLLAAYDAQTSRNFNVLIATDSSTASITNVSVTDCDGLDRVFSANDGATVTVTDATVSDVSGTQPPDLLSNIAMAEDGGSMNVLRLTATDITFFSAPFFAICGSYIQVKQSCVMGGNVAVPVFISADSKFDSDGNYINTEELNVARCLNDPAASVFTENSSQDQCFSNTGTGTCDGQCVGGFTEALECQSKNPSADLTLSPQASPGGAGGNPSCPASPPTPVPTMPPELGGPGGDPNGDLGTIPPGGGLGTIPPGNPGAGVPAGSSPGAAPGLGGGGGDNGNGDNVFTATGGTSSSATSLLSLRCSQLLHVGSALVVARLLNRLMF